MSQYRIANKFIKTLVANFFQYCTTRAFLTTPNCGRGEKSQLCQKVRQIIPTTFLKGRLTTLSHLKVKRNSYETPCIHFQYNCFAHSFPVQVILGQIQCCFNLISMITAQITLTSTTAVCLPKDLLKKFSIDPYSITKGFYQQLNLYY